MEKSPGMHTFVYDPEQDMSPPIPEIARGPFYFGPDYDHVVSADLVEITKFV